jgi:hypothetical protein
MAVFRSVTRVNELPGRVEQTLPCVDAVNEVLDRPKRGQVNGRVAPNRKAT